MIHFCKRNVSLTKLIVIHLLFIYLRVSLEMTSFICVQYLLIYT